MGSGHSHGGDGLADHRGRLAAVLAITAYIILDLEYPRIGVIRLDAVDQLLAQLRQTMN